MCDFEYDIKNVKAKKPTDQNITCLFHSGPIPKKGQKYILKKKY